MSKQDIITIVGLGNNREKYFKTYHNLGFLFVDFLSQKFGCEDFQFDRRNNVFMTRGEIDGRTVILAKPDCFMNESGLYVRKFLDYYKMNADNFWIAHDDSDLEIFSYKIQKDRSSAGHNGVQSVIDHLGTQNFGRIRFGIRKKEYEGKKALDVVLKKMTNKEFEKIQKIFGEIFNVLKF